MNKFAKPKDVVQIMPPNSWDGCFMVVTESKDWGVQGYVQIPESDGLAYYRAGHDEYVIIGSAALIYRNEF